MATRNTKRKFTPPRFLLSLRVSCGHSNPLSRAQNHGRHCPAPLNPTFCENTNPPAHHLESDGCVAITLRVMGRNEQKPSGQAAFGVSDSHEKHKNSRKENARRHDFFCVSSCFLWPFRPSLQGTEPRSTLSGSVDPNILSERQPCQLVTRRVTAT